MFLLAKDCARICSAFHNRFFPASDMSFSEYVVHRSAAIDLSPCVKRGRDCDRPNALGLPCALHYKKRKYILN